MKNSALSASDLRAAFPDALLTIVPREIRRLKRAVHVLDDLSASIRLRHYDLTTERILLIMVSTAIEYAIHEAGYDPMRQLKRLQALLLPPVPANGRITDGDISRARSRLITDLYQFERVRTVGRRTTAICPLHSPPERTPSFVIYPDTGRGQNFHCFSCHANGSAIDFIMRLNGVNFIQAVRFLI